MNIDKGSFFILVATLGAGGVGGYVASERHLIVPPPPPPPPPKETASAAAAPPPPASTPPPPPPKPAPTCDDQVGSPGTCPPPGWPAEEGGCGALPTKRCEEYKRAFKPRVAERAVACINALNATQRCDPNRLNLCGHAALMSACSIVDESPPPSSASAGGSALDAAPDEVTTTCNAILHGCEGVTLGPTMRDCRATLAGISVLGRDRMVACMKAHCNDKGLLFCEAQLDANAR
jgi:hypothetical protein